MRVFTAVFNRYDRVRSPKRIDIGWDYTVVCNPWMAVPAPWDVSVRPMVDDKPRLSARYYKIMAHETFPSTAITVWHGGNVQLRTSPSELVDLLGDDDIAVLRHSQRQSVYDEGAICVRWHKDSTQVIKGQMARYEEEGFPGTPLSAAFLIVRRHTDRIAALNELWWDEVKNGSVRDQLSFDYCCWRLEIEPTVIPGDIFSGPNFRRHPIH